MGLWWGFKLEVTDIEEFPVETSLVPVLNEVVKQRTKTRKLTGGADAALRAFKYALGENAGEKVTSNHVPADVEVLTVSVWRRYFDKLTTSEGTPDALRKRFERALARMSELRLAAKWGEYWWLTPAGQATP